MLDFGFLYVPVDTSPVIPYLTPAPNGLTGLITESIGKSFLKGLLPSLFVISAPVTTMLSTMLFILYSNVQPVFNLIDVFCSRAVFADVVADTGIILHPCLKRHSSVVVYHAWLLQNCNQ